MNRAVVVLVVLAVGSLAAAAASTDDRHPWLSQMVRQELLHKYCDANNLGGGGPVRLGQLDHILVDRSHGLLYCYVPKVACTNWKRVMMVLTGMSNATRLVDIPPDLVHTPEATVRLSDLGEAEAAACLTNYTTFVMVRHPFERVLSAYRNKFLGNSTYFKERYGRTIVKKYRKEAEQEEEENPTFGEFVQYLLEDGARENEHWTPVYDLCLPCKVNYTFVGHYETLGQDSRTLLDMIGAPPLLFPQTRTHGTSDLVRRYLQELSIYDIKSLYDVYRHDFEMFGYSLEHLLGYDLA